jgi:hypothetical protein
MLDSDQTPMVVYGSFNFSSITYRSEGSPGRRNDVASEKSQFLKLSKGILCIGRSKNKGKNRVSRVEEG